MKDKADIGLVGLAVMGENLILNMESKGFTVAVLQPHGEQGGRLRQRPRQGQEHHRLPQHRGARRPAWRSPRRIMLMVKAGKPVDEFIEQLVPHLEQGDIIIDGGNSHFPDTIRRTQGAGGEGPALHRHRRLRRRGRRAARARHHARRQPRGVAAA